MSCTGPFEDSAGDNNAIEQKQFMQGVTSADLDNCSASSLLSLLVTGLSNRRKSVGDS